MRENLTEKSTEQSKYQSKRKFISESSEKSVAYSDEESARASIFESNRLSFIDEPVDTLLCQKLASSVKKDTWNNINNTN